MRKLKLNLKYTIMAKSQDSKKNVKTEPAKTKTIACYNR